ncbi:MAG TPA: protein kinase [Polyangiaceae bacterium]|jgi:serine/threonine-protein kinase|nr:protein kinase [Polyangiaceae bacterium]
MAAAPDPVISQDEQDPRVGLLLSERYRVDALIDSGGMGRVYVGEHVLMHKRVAIKVLHRELSSIPEFVARFEREARAAGNIDNEHVVAATDFGKLPDGAVFLVLEYVEGRNLRDEIAQGPMPLARTLHIARQMTNALRTAHALGIVHRDLKPENVMLVDKSGDGDFVKVLDFGIAKVPIGERRAGDTIDKPITKAGMVFGTPEYMPPEQALGQNVDARADLYSLGVIVYEMLAGRRPFIAEDQVGVLGQQLSKSAPPVSKRAPGVYIPPAIDAFVKKMIQREASKRFQTADQVLDEIDRHLGYASGRRRIPTLHDGSTQVGGLSTDPAPIGGSDPSRLSIPGLEKPLERLGAWVDDRRSRLPPALRRLPAPVLFSVPLALAGLLVGFGVFAALSPHDAAPAASASSSVPAARGESVPSEVTTPPPAANVDTASSSEVAAASESGVPALRALAAKHPQDASIQVAIGATALKNKEPRVAVEALTAALSLDPKLEDDAQMASALWILAQSKASSDAAFELLERPMGARGKSILRDLTTTDGVRPAIRKKARLALREANSDVASP